MQVSAFIERVRPEIGDKTSTYRWADANFLKPISDGEREIVSRVPEAKYVSAITTDALTEHASVTESILVTDDYINALLHYVAFRLLSELQDAGNIAAAKEHYSLFREEFR